MGISGNYAIVGANGFEGPDGNNQGKVYWYERQRDGKWVRVQTQLGENATDNFGISVAISGNYAIVGALGFDGSKGKVYWYERQRDGKWVQVHTQVGENGGDRFGNSVAISGNYAIVGANGFEGGTDRGKVYWYERQRDGKWVKIHEQPGETAGERFGNSVAISGNYAIVGANGFDGVGFNTRGKAYWYERQRDGKWVKIHEQPGENGSDQFGWSVGISGNYAIVGARGFESAKGKAYWYERQRDGKWVQIHTQPGDSVGDLFGNSVGISGNYAIVGAYGFNSIGANQGKVYWYQKQNSGEWKEVHTQPGENGGDVFGESVAISGNYAIVGANEFPGTSPIASRSGKAYFYLKKY